MRYSIKLNINNIELFLDSDKDVDELEPWLLDNLLNSFSIKWNLDGTKFVSYNASKVSIDSIVNLDGDYVTKTIKAKDIILQLMRVKDTTSVRVAEVLELAYHICNRLRKDKSLFIRYDGPYSLTYYNLYLLCCNSSMFLFDTELDLIRLSQKYRLENIPDLQLDDTILKMIDDFIGRYDICSMK